MTSLPESVRDKLTQVVGYLNFSSGAHDPQTLRHLNELHTLAAAGKPLAGKPPWFDVKQWLLDALQHCAGSSAAFADVSQAQRAIEIVFSLLPPAYLDFHKDLLFHQEPELLFNGLFVGRCTEVVLRLLKASEEDADVVQLAIETLNDFVGYRPIPQLDNRHCEPYPNEWVAPIPVYFKDVGFGSGCYRRLFQQSLEVLQLCDPEILRAGHFELERLQELAVDPRAYDFDHPVNKRPNYQFGQWDPHAIDAEGFYRRFVVQQVTIDALLSRLGDQQSGLPRDEIHFEAAAVLAGTMLMGAAVSGWGPGAYSSEVTLSSLIGPIARIRDAFYEDLLGKVPGVHGERLRQEQRLRQQPFGAARQHLNAALASQRAGQQQHAHLARLYARMGYTDAASDEADLVNAPSARIMCRIDCLFMEGTTSLRRGDLELAARMPRQIVQWIKRGIVCGAFIDPWDILGFAGNFARFHCSESAVHDHRTDEIVQLTDYLFGYMARVWSEAAARDDREHYEQLHQIYRDTSLWWRQYAAHTIADLNATDPLESYQSAELVAKALRVWHRGGAETGDVSFWAQHAEMFDSPRAYALVIDALLERGDFVASRALLVHWLANVDAIGLRRGNSSWPRLAQRWLYRLIRRCRQTEDVATTAGATPGVCAAPDQAWTLAQRFFDQVEANADSLWEVPTFVSAGPVKERDWDSWLADLEREDGPRDGDAQESGKDDGLQVDEDGDAADEGLFDAAYEGITFRDSTDDGVEGSVFDPGGAKQEEEQDSLEAESRRLIEHLEFHAALARMWIMAADMGPEAQTEASASGTDHLAAQRQAKLQEWAQQTAANRRQLLNLLESVRAFRVSPTGTDTVALARYDRSRVTRDALLERIIATVVQVSDARRLLLGVLLAETTAQHKHEHEQTPGQTRADAQPTVTPKIHFLEPALLAGLGEDDHLAIELFASLLVGDQAAVREKFPILLAAIRSKSLLYMPLVRGGDPAKIFVARLRQRVLTHLLRWLPNCGLVFESCQLLEAARMMEQQNPIGSGAVTEFDGLFKIGFSALVRAATRAARMQPVSASRSAEDQEETTSQLIGVLESLTETLMISWLKHSQSLRLSSLEAVEAPPNWDSLVTFVKMYGEPLFRQTNLTLGHIRAILHQGVGHWLDDLKEDPGHLEESRLVSDLRDGADPEPLCRMLSVVFEAILDYHVEFMDYTSTTTQSDRGDLLYMFLDFLRLRVRYDRIAWKLRPVMWAHEILVSDGFDAAAMLWRQSLTERIGGEAERFVKQLRLLQQRYSMRMPSVADRIQERFVQSMTVDRMRALIGPAIIKARQGQASSEFELLQSEANRLTAHPAGAGLDLPQWLGSIEQEVEEVMNRQEGMENAPDALLTIPQSRTTLNQLAEQLGNILKQGRRLPYMR